MRHPGKASLGDGSFLGGNAGLGHLVVASLNTLDAPRLFAVIAFLTVLGAVLLGAVTLAERLTVPWHDSQRGDH